MDRTALLVNLKGNTCPVATPREGTDDRMSGDVMWNSNYLRMIHHQPEWPHTAA